MQNYARKLSSSRQMVLQAAEHLYRFQTDVAALSSWMKKVFNRMASETETRNIKEAKSLLEMHEEILSELRVRKEVFLRVHEYGHLLITEGGLPADEVEPKLQHLEEERKELEEIWKRQKIRLKESFDIQVSFVVYD